MSSFGAAGPKADLPATGIMIKRASDINTPERLWEVADNIEKLAEQMQERGYPLTAIPLERWQEDTRSDTEVQRLAKVLSQQSEPPI